MASIDRRRGKWRVQVRRHGHALIKTFALKHDAEARMRKFGAREVERAIDQERDPTVRRVSRKDTFASLIDLHIEDLSAHGKPIRRSKDAVLRRLRVELGEVPVAQFTRERLIRYGRQRARDRAGPAPLSIDISFIGTVLTHAAAVHGLHVDTEAVRLARVALSKVGLIGNPEERDRHPTEDELKKLYAYFNANARLTLPMTRIVQLAIASAMRQDEIFRIEWTHLDARTLLVLNRKDPRRKDSPPPARAAPVRNRLRRLRPA